MSKKLRCHDSGAICRDVYREIYICRDTYRDICREFSYVVIHIVIKYRDVYVVGYVVGYVVKIIMS